MKKKSVLHIVRRYGCVGGMERYVWELTHELVELGLNITIVCEDYFGRPDERILVHKVPRSIGPSAPRWKQMCHFRRAVASYIKNELIANPNRWIIHSHERSTLHHITTFHGAPINNKSNRFVPKFFNRRIRAWEDMERDELLTPSVQWILPVSNILKAELLARYPAISRIPQAIAWPGVRPVYQTFQADHQKETGRNFLFVGKEWHRKGLDLAVSIVELLALNQDVKLDIYGPEPRNLPKWIVKSPVVSLKGWVEDIPWSNYSALIHPARIEPFGMVVAEARQQGLPVLTSNKTGSVGLNFDGVAICSPDDSISTWCHALHDLLLSSSVFNAEEPWTWRQLALMHSEQIYPTVAI